MYKKHLKHIIVNEKLSLYKAFWIFNQNKTILIVVDDQDKFVGVVGKDDFKKAYSDQNLDIVTIGGVCNKNCKKIYDQEDIYKTGRHFFSDYFFNNIPVITNDGDIIDVFTRERAFYRQYYIDGKLERMHYAAQIWGAAQEAKRLGYSAFSVLEFGVAGGNGLLNCEFHAREISRILDIEINVYGFDTATGLPEGDAGYKDLLHLWPKGIFQMDPIKLKDRLQFAKLVLGDIKKTATTFCMEEEPAPIGSIFIDVDYYSSTVPILEMLKQDNKFFLPRIYMYFDDVNAYYEFSGESLAIKEFNQCNEIFKISPETVPIDNIGGWIDGFEGWSGWAPCEKRLKMCHRFDHPLYNKALYLSDSKSLENNWTTVLR